MPAVAQHHIGSFLGRPVACVAVEHGADLGAVALEGMLVLVNTGDSQLVNEERGKLADQLVLKSPLATFFTGTDAEAMFDVLIRALDVSNAPLPMMTNFSVSNLLEAVDEFLTATWPPEERWHEWQGYLLINIGGPVAVVEEAASPLLDC